LSIKRYLFEMTEGTTRKTWLSILTSINVCL
jgi:hypothetical protein